MKRGTISMLLAFLVGSAHADIFLVGGQELEIPPPHGFSRVTQEMDAVYRLSSQMTDPVNDQLAYYIAQSDVPAALAGEIPSLERFFIVKANKRIKKIVMGSGDFAEIKDITKRQNEKILESVESQMPSHFENISKGLSEEFDVDFAVQLAGIVPLDPHYESDNALAYSMYLNYGASVEGTKEHLIVAATATFVNVAGKVLFLYGYGPQEELEWTRNASRAWADVVMASNAQPPAGTSSSGGIDWSEVLETGLMGAIVGALVAFAFGIVRRSGRKKGN